MRIFVYEHLTGGGLWIRGSPAEASPSLLAEGAAMLGAIVADFARLDDCQVCITCDGRLRQSLAPPPQVSTVSVESAEAAREAFSREAADADRTLLIAPETDGVLLERAQAVESLGGRLLSPPSACIEIAASKQASAELLRQSGVPVPTGFLLTGGQPELPAGFPFPAVVKPVDGCGSMGVRLISSRVDVGDLSLSTPMRIEEFIPGLSASVAVLCGPAGNYALVACQQLLSRNGRFQFLGGRTPLPENLDGRARRLALAAVEALPQPRGYLGVDLVLGEADDGSGDRVIEINPRLTTSYIGLRALAQTNLAAAMLDVAVGRPPNLRFGAGPVEFSASGGLVKAQ